MPHEIAASKLPLGLLNASAESLEVEE